ncbi:hypothetical protein DLn1_00017 [Bacillus phage DLn1]|nr:hypothetical protein DLn1_00017 [Bacillus phage DLn1]
MMERIKVNFNMGGLKIHQGEIPQESISYGKDCMTLKSFLKMSGDFICIYNKFDSPIEYNKNSIVWICVQREE